MKKFVKFGMIGAGIAAALGIVLMIAGTIMGATLSSLADSLNSNAFVTEMADYLSGLYAAAPTESVTIVDMGIPETWPAHGEQILGCWDASEVTSIDFEFAVGNLEIIPMYDSNQILLEAMSPVGITGSSLNNGHLEINLDGGSDAGLYLLIPGDLILDYLKFDGDSGYIAASGLCVNSLEVELDSGAYFAEGLEVNQTLKFDMDAGDINAYDVYCGGLTVSNDTGYVWINGNVGGDINLDTDIGSVELSLNTNPESYNYDLSCDLGNIWLNGNEFSGFGNNHTIDNGADYTIYGQCDMGSISIYFQ